MSMLEANAARFAALGHPARLGILRRIVQGPEEGTPVGDIQQSLGIPPSTLSHHLSSLSGAGLVSVARRGTFLLYRADFESLRQLTGYLWQDCCSRAGQETCPPAPAEAPEPAPSSLTIEED